MKMYPYLHFGGDCRAAFAFYAQVLDGTIGLTMTYSQAPDQSHIPENSKDRIMHMVLHTRDITLMGSDAPPGAAVPAGGFSLSVHPTDPAEADRVFAALAEGGTVKMPIQETFWAHRFGMLNDKFGTPWMVSCDKSA